MPEKKTLTAMTAEELNEYVVNLGIAPASPAKKRNICIAILAYDAKMFVATHTSLMMTVVALGQQGWGVSFVNRDNDSMVARGRNYLASQFLENPQLAHCTDLLMFDTDLEWKGEDVVKLCNHPVDVVAGPYPYKDDSGNFPLQWDSAGLEEDTTTGLWKVRAVTPGFLRVTRRVLEKMARDMPWLQYRDKPDEDGQRSFMFFDNIQRPNGVYDEGYIFCERWRACGGEVWIDPDISISHIGLKRFNSGTLRDWLTRKAETTEKLMSEHPDVPPLQLAGFAMKGEKNGLQQKQPVP